MVKVQLTQAQRARYVRWWKEDSGLTKGELREIANGVWADRLFEEARKVGHADAA